jgi:hypothetical protein
MSDISFVVIDDEIDDLVIDAEGVGLRRIEPTDETTAGLDLDPLTTALLIGAGVLAARFVVTVWDKYKGGVRIDLGTEPPVVERVKEVPYGMVVVFTKDDEVRIETHDEPKEVVERILTAIFSLPKEATPADVNEKAEAARKAA